MIPKIIHYCWFGGGELPYEDKKRIEQWKRLCPDYKIQRWDESNYDVTKNQYMYEAYKSKKWGFVPDFARIDIVFHEGGIYFDTDVELVKRPDKLLEYKGFFGFESESYINLGHGFGAEPQNELLKKMLDFYKERSFIIDGRPNLTASPVFTTECIKAYGFSLGNKKQELKGNILLPFDYLCAKDPFTGIIQKTENTYTIHHFTGSWLSKKQKKETKIREYLLRKFGTTWGKYLWTTYWYIFIHKKKKIIHFWNKHILGKNINEDWL